MGIHDEVGHCMAWTRDLHVKTHAQSKPQGDSGWEEINGDLIVSKQTTRSSTESRLQMLLVASSPRYLQLQVYLYPTDALNYLQLSPNCPTWSTTDI
jgi:hypothetical protein